MRDYASARKRFVCRFFPRSLLQHVSFPTSLAAYSKYMRVLGPFFDVIDADFSSLREIARDLLQQEKDLSEIVQLVGRDSLSEDQKVRASNR